MSFTIVVPTHDRYRTLRNLLASIRENRVPALASVIVVDDSKDKEELTGFGDIRLHHIKSDSRLFISRAKNIGWRASQTDFVFFIDDDNVLDGMTLATTLDRMLRSPRMGAMMLAVLYKARPSLVWVYATPFRDRRLGLSLLGRNLPRNSALEGRLLPTDALPNASLVRRAALQEVGGFDEALVVNSSLDFAQRLKKRGWLVASFTGSFAYHDVDPPGRIGWWATHGAADPERVRFEIRDWFLIMQKLHGRGSLVLFSSILYSARFVLPNLLAYLLRGGSRRKLIRSLAVGYLEGVRRTH